MKHLKIILRDQSGYQAFGLVAKLSRRQVVHQFQEVQVMHKNLIKMIQMQMLMMFRVVSLQSLLATKVYCHEYYPNYDLRFA